MLWQLVVVAAALGAAYYRWSRRRLYRLAREIPSGMKEYPIVGHAYKFLGSSEDRLKSIQELGNIANRQGGLSSLWQGNRLFICMTDAKDIEVVAKACLDKDESTMRYLREVFGNGSVFAPVSIWHPRRKIMAPFFSLKNLNQLVPLFHEKSSNMVDLMQSEVGGGDFSIWKYLTTMTFNTVCETAVGTKINAKNLDHCVLRAVDELTHMVAKRILQPWLHPDLIYQRLPVFKRFLYHMKQKHTFVDEIIQKKRIEYSVASQEGKSKYPTRDTKPGEIFRRPSAAATSSGGNSFIDMILQSSGDKKGYSDLELREEAQVLIVAGNDTTAVGSCFTAVLLSRYPDVQDRVYQELLEVFGGSDREITSEDLPRLKYLEAVIRESLRLYPPVPAIVREVHTDVQLPSGTTLVDGTSVVIHTLGVNRNPAYWGADAELFHPERFLEGPLRHPAMFMTFSHSLRACSGATYAMMSAKTSLANLLRRYKLLPPANVAAEDLTKPLRMQFDIMMKAVDNFAVRIEERKKM